MNYLKHLCVFALAAFGSSLVSGCGGGGNGSSALGANQSRILFASVRGEENPSSLYTFNPSGGDLKRVVRGETLDTRFFKPVFNSNGSQIAFLSSSVSTGRGSRGPFPTTLSFVNSDGGNRRTVRVPLPAPIPGEVSVSAVDFTPDGNRIVFSGSRYISGILEKNTETIYTSNLDGSGFVGLTSPDGFSQDNNIAPDVGPDGQIVFASNRDNPPATFNTSRDVQREIYVMNADGSNPTRLTDTAEDNTEPTWSPDGRRIVFQSRRDGQSEIYAINANGSGLTRLTNNAAEDTDPSVGPDGRIAFTSTRDSVLPKIYVMNADGSNPKRLASNEGANFNPNWH